MSATAAMGVAAGAVRAMALAQSAAERVGEGTPAPPPRPIAMDAVHRLTDLAWDWGPRLLGALVIVLVAWALAKRARRSLYRAFDRPHIDQTLLRFSANAVRWVLLVVALVAALGVLGFPPASVVTVMGAAGLAVGLALQGSLANLAAGIMLLVLRPFKVGDTITVAGVTGKVDDIELFQTKLDTPDNRRVIMPNSQVFGNVIDNQTHHAARAITVPVSVDPEADLDITKAALERALDGVPGRAASPSPAVVLDAVGSGGVTWNVTVWCPTAQMGAVRQGLLRAVKAGLAQAGVAGAVPTTVVLQRAWPGAGVPSVQVNGAAEGLRR
jgi:small conductance mechanosensitive channel